MKEICYPVFESDPSEPKKVLFLIFSYTSTERRILESKISHEKAFTEMLLTLIIEPRVVEKEMEASHWQFPFQTSSKPYRFDRVLSLYEHI